MESSQLSKRELVREIAQERGHLGEDKLSKIGEIDPELRRTVEEALLRKDEMIGSGVLTYVHGDSRYSVHWRLY